LRRQAISRVHALNILRLIILDASLAAEVKPFAGSAIATSIVGYDDPNWAVRNSSTMVFASVMLRIVDPDKNANNRDSTSRNAITLKELFLCYPSLPRFLLSVLESNIAELTKTPDSKSKCRIESVLYPPLFHILLLMSRVELISQSGSEAAELAKPFVRGILLCLTHRHEALRRAAARALANLRSGDDFSDLSTATLLRQCLNILEGGSVHDSEGKNGKDWNSKHGALLGIRELLETVPAALFADLTLYERVVKMATWHDFSYACPPDCVSVALETWSSAAFSIKDTKEINQLTKVSSKLLATISLMEEIIGVSRLGIIAARIVCRSLTERLWNIDTEYTDWQNAISLLRAMLSVDMIDARLEFVKVFKKGTCVNIDRLMTESGQPIASKAKLLNSISEALFSSLLLELNTNRSHPPTIRRLSRCLLECVYAFFEHLDPSDQASTPQFRQAQAGDLWDASNLMMDKFLGSKFNSEETDCNLVSGNALELMGVALGAWLEQVQDPSEMLERTTRLYDLTWRLSNPSLSWKLRYSAARAIDASRLLRRLDNKFATHKNFTKLQQIQYKLHLLLMKMLQDCDADVRQAASKALQRARSSGTTTASFVPLHDLTEALTQLQDMVDKGFANILFQEIHDSCSGIDSTMKQTNEELACSRFLSSASSNLLNVGMERKIFEEEDPNPSCEMLLSNQLMVRALVAHSPSGTITSTTDSMVAVQEQLVAKCRGALSFIVNSSVASATTSSDLVHDLTRSNAIFPALHSLILGSICVLYRGGGGTADREVLKQLALQIIEAQSGASCVHPRILEALHILSKTTTTFVDDSNESFHQVCKCCFLLPRTVYSE
jgi:hypothetical protein